MSPPGFILLTLILVFLAFQLRPLWRARRMRGRAAPDPGQWLPEARGLDPVGLYLWSPACGMCKAMTPLVHQLAAEGLPLVAVDVAGHPDLARALGVLATPSLVLVRDGRIERILVGAKGEQAIRRLFEGAD